ncbi:hypothetical protein LTR84_009554 [Exophiala bonariae]|uniref:NmrA-like domain-containing protein n=1 Tax=Exophiala bonariae TaxID=1690606 RepID=A0AAV9MUD1_9EURO|nr:hypothetical protein LTR84_009554 [Exophiala bonariae]
MKSILCSADHSALTQYFSYDTMDRRLVVIFTATGNQGYPIAKYFLQDPIAKSHYVVRALTRDVTKPLALELAALGAEVVKCDLDSEQDVNSAVARAHAIYANTDFWSVYTVEGEVAQGRRILSAASTLPTLEVFIQSSFPNAVELSNGQFKNVLHYNAKNELNEISKTQFPTLWNKTICIWVGYYYSNWIKFNYPFGPQKDSSTSPPTYVLAKPYPSSTIFASVNPDDLGPAINALLKSGTTYMRKNISFLAEEQTDAERLEIFGTTLGVRTIFQEIEPEEYSKKMAEAGMPPHIVQNVTEQLLLIRTGNYMAQKRDDIIPIRDILPEYRFKSWQEYVKEADWSSIL